MYLKPLCILSIVNVKWIAFLTHLAETTTLVSNFWNDKTWHCLTFKDLLWLVFYHEFRFNTKGLKSIYLSVTIFFRQISRKQTFCIVWHLTSWQSLTNNQLYLSIPDMLDSPLKYDRYSCFPLRNEYLILTIKIRVVLWRAIIILSKNYSLSCSFNG